MQAYADDDIARTVDTLLHQKWDTYEYLADKILAAVAPSIAARVLRQAADEWDEWGQRDAGWGDHLRDCAADIAASQ